MNKNELEQVFQALLYVKRENNDSISNEYEKMNDKILNGWYDTSREKEYINSALKKVYNMLNELEQ